jgi:hypothetical protein
MQKDVIPPEKAVALPEFRSQFDSPEAIHQAIIAISARNRAPRAIG